MMPVQPQTLPTPVLVPSRRIVGRPLPRIDAPEAIAHPPADVRPPLPIEESLARAESLIDAREYRDALAEYREVLSRLKGDEGLQRQLSASTMRVYSKLLLHKRLDEAAHALGREDVDGLKRALEDARHLAQEIGEEDTPLVREASAAYARFAKSVNSLEIGRIAQY